MSLDDMMRQKGSKFDGFMAIGANAISREPTLSKLHEAMPYGVFIDVNPAPGLVRLRAARPATDHA